MRIIENQFTEPKEEIINDPTFLKKDEQNNNKKTLLNFFSNSTLNKIKNSNAEKIITDFTSKNPELIESIKPIIKNIIWYKKSIQKSKNEYYKLNKSDIEEKIRVNDAIINSIIQLNQDDELCDAFWAILRQINIDNGVSINELESLQSGLMGELAVQQGLEDYYQDDSNITIRRSNVQEDIEGIDLIINKPNKKNINLQIKINSNSHETYLEVLNENKIEGKRLIINQDSDDPIIDNSTGRRIKNFGISFDKLLAKKIKEIEEIEEINQLSQIQNKKMSPQARKMIWEEKRREKQNGRK